MPESYPLMRGLMKIIAGRLDELNDTRFNSAPPVDTSPDPERGGPRSGKYWFKGTRTVGVTGDFATEPLRDYAAFGFDPRAILAWLQTHYPEHPGSIGVAEQFRRQLAIAHPDMDLNVPDDNYQQYLRNNLRPDVAFSSLGARQASLSYAFEQDWAFIEYDEARASIWLDPARAKTAVLSAGRLFPLVGMSNITIIQRGQPEVFPTRSVEFHREDTPGFAGAFSALMKWAKTGEVPEQHWLYVLVPPDSGITIDDRGLHPEPGQYVQTGNWTDRDVYGLPYHVRKMVPVLLRNRPGTLYRFPARVAADLGLETGGGGQPTLFSKRPFVIPRDVLQRNTVAGWQPAGTALGETARVRRPSRCA